MLAKTLIEKMGRKDRNLVRDGASVITIWSGAIAYYNYREKIRKDFARSEAHYRFSTLT
jgi:hypothetical protein